MKRWVPIITAAAALSACSYPPLPAPNTVADRITLDETGARGVEVAYKAWRLLIETATDAGVLRGARAAQMATLDDRLFALTQATQAAYRASNAASYRAAVNEANAAFAAALVAFKGN